MHWGNDITAPQKAWSPDPTAVHGRMAGVVSPNLPPLCSLKNIALVSGPLTRTLAHVPSLWQHQAAAANGPPIHRPPSVTPRGQILAIHRSNPAWPPSRHSMTNPIHIPDAPTGPIPNENSHKQRPAAQIIYQAAHWFEHIDQASDRVPAKCVVTALRPRITLPTKIYSALRCCVILSDQPKNCPNDPKAARAMSHPTLTPAAKWGG